MSHASSSSHPGNDADSVRSSLQPPTSSVSEKNDLAALKDLCLLWVGRDILRFGAVRW